MAPNAEYAAAELAVSLSSAESSKSSYFKGELENFDEGESASLNTVENEEDDFSVETPSVESIDFDAVSIETPTIDTPSVKSMDFGAVSIETPTIGSIQTPSLAEEVGFIFESVIHSIVGKKETDNNPTLNKHEHEQIIIEGDEDEDEYDEYMNRHSNKSYQIMNKRAAGLVAVLSTLEQDRSNDIDEGKTTQLVFSQNNGGNDDRSKVRVITGITTKKAPAVTSAMVNQVKTTQQRSSSRSRLVATGLKGMGRRMSRSMSPAPKAITPPQRSRSKSRFSEEYVTDSASVGLSTRGRSASRRRFVNVTKIDLAQRRDVEVLLNVKKYEEMLNMIYENPKILAIQANQPNGKTFLHTIADMPNPPPETVILKVIAVDTSLVTATDNSNNTPLHLASYHVRKANMHAFSVLLKFHPMGCSERNSDGDLPLHIVASNTSKGAEEAAHLILDTNPKAITEPNNKGRIPLHIALSEGSTNIKLLSKILHIHKFRKCDVDILDNKGNTPLHCAILHGTKIDAMQLFNKEMRESHLKAYVKENERGYIPLHVALMTAKTDPHIVLSLIKAAPYSAGIPTPGGDMPVALATKARMKPEIVKLLLASDLPIELGNKDGKAGMGVIVEREHGHSWWHVAVECQSRYVDVVTSLLSEHATFVQIVALVRCLGPDRKTLTLDAISAPMEAALRNLLRFYFRYELSMARMPVCSNEIQSFAAKDHGEDLEKMKVTGPWLNNGFTTIEEDDRKMKADNKACEIEYVPWERKAKEVTLRCYAFEDAFDAERKYREEHNISSQFFEDIVKIHRVVNYANASFTSGKLLCIAFEKNDVTLRELMDDETARANRNWLVKCHLLLKDVATSLNHLHNQSLVHGHLDAITIAKFQSKWKVLYIGQSTTMGNAMSGSLRRCAPPESLSGTKPTSNFNASSRNKYSKNGSDSKPRSKKSLITGRTRIPGLPPLPDQDKNTRKHFVFFGGSPSKSRNVNGRAPSSIGMDGSMQSSIADSASGHDMSEADTGSLRIIAMQEDEITRLRQALEEKEHIYRRQLFEERAEFKRQEVERQRELQLTRANVLQRARDNLFRFAPEKVMASPSWDIWSFGLLMVELILGKTPLVPSFANSDDEFLEKLMSFQDDEVAAVREEVRRKAGDLAADLVARLLHPKPMMRIESMAKVLQHKYFHEEIVETIQIYGRGKKLSTSNKMKHIDSSDAIEVESHALQRDRGRVATKISSNGQKVHMSTRSTSRRRLLKS